MTRESFDPGLQLIIVDGNDKGALFCLASRRIQLGRKDPAFPDEGASRISFPESTVSGLHASLEWDDKRNRYLLTHHSRTNHTLVDGKVVSSPVYIHVGSKIKLGTLLLQVKLTPQAVKAEPAPMALPNQVGAASLAASGQRSDKGSNAPPVPASPGFAALVLNGADAASIFPVIHDSQLLQEHGAGPSNEPIFSIRGLGKCRALLHWKPPQVHVTCGEIGERPVLIDNPLAGVVRQRLVGPELGCHFSEESVLLFNNIALTIVPAQETAKFRERLLAGETVNRMQGGLFREGDRIWNRGEQHLFRIVAGPFKGMHLWIEPRRYETPIRFGRLGQGALVELTDRGAATIEILYKGENFVLHNADPEVAVAFNMEELLPLQQAQLCSGDRFRLGRTVVRYEYLPIQARIDTYSIQYERHELPLMREQNWLGNSPQVDLRIEDQRLGPMHGRIVVGESSLRYQHRQPGTVAKVNGKELRAGEEMGLRVDTTVELLPGLSFRVVRRSAAAQPLETAQP